MYGHVRTWFVLCGVCQVRLLFVRLMLWLVCLNLIIYAYDVMMLWDGVLLFSLCLVIFLSYASRCFISHTLHTWYECLNVRKLSLNMCKGISSLYKIDHAHIKGELAHTWDSQMHEYYIFYLNPIVLSSITKRGRLKVHLGPLINFGD
jgi:hypothetical protein